MLNKKFDSLINVSNDLYAVIAELEGVVNRSLINEFLTVHERLYNLTKLDKENSEFSIEDIENLQDIADENNFKSVWCVRGIKEKNLNELLPFKVGKVIYAHEKVVNSQITWLEFWKIADELIKKGGDEDHIYIEVLNKSLNKENPGFVDIEIYTGS